MIRERLTDEARAHWSDIDWQLVANEEGSVEGAAVYWVPDLRDLGLESGERLGAWRAALNQNQERPARDVALYADISTLIAFDYIIANADRWSGGNIKGNASRDRVVVRDHNLAFAVPMAASRLNRITTSLERVERFSRAFVVRLQRLSRPSLQRELMPDAGGDRSPLLDEEEFRAMWDRVQTVRSYVGSLVDQYGTDRVLAFP